MAMYVKKLPVQNLQKRIRSLPECPRQIMRKCAFEAALVEDDDFDLLVMGRTQGKGCYCYVNGLLQAQLAKYQNNYPYIVVDNEAGMEHISRGVLPSVQTADSGQRLLQKGRTGSRQNCRTDQGM